MRVGLNKPGFSHIVCFRRQIFVEPDDIKNIPSDFTVNHDDTTYYIYVTTDKMACFLCKKEGHTTKYCPQNDHRSSQNTNVDAAFPLLPTAVKAGGLSEGAPSPRESNSLHTKTVTYDLIKLSQENQQTPAKNDSHVFNGQELFSKSSTLSENRKRPLSTSSTATANLQSSSPKNTEFKPSTKKTKSEKLTS